jgi:hypothetical protein
MRQLTHLAGLSLPRYVLSLSLSLSLSVCLCVSPSLSVSKATKREKA